MALRGWHERGFLVLCFLFFAANSAAAGAGLEIRILKRRIEKASGRYEEKESRSMQTRGPLGVTKFNTGRICYAASAQLLSLLVSATVAADTAPHARVRRATAEWSLGRAACLARCCFVGTCSQKPHRYTGRLYRKSIPLVLCIERFPNTWYLSNRAFMQSDTRYRQPCAGTTEWKLDQSAGKNTDSRKNSLRLQEAP